MAVLIALVVVLAALLVVNLVLTLGVVRRLNDHEQRFVELDPVRAVPSQLIMAAGARVHDFTATTLDGEVVARDQLVEPTLVAFLSTHCDSCRAIVPGLVELAAQMPGGRSRVLVVVVDHDQNAAVFAKFRSDLGGVARIARDTDDGVLPTAFDIQGFPAVCVVDGGGIVRSSGDELAGIAVPSPL